MSISKDEIIVSTYGPFSRNDIPDAAKFGGVAVTPGNPGRGDPAVIQATEIRNRNALDPKMRDQR